MDNKTKIIIGFGTLCTGFIAGVMFTNEINSRDKQVKKWRYLAEKYHENVVNVNKENFELKQKIKDQA